MDEQDLVEAVLWLREHAPAGVALDFLDAVEEALELLSRHPLAGSGWVGTRLGIPELRSFPASGTGYILFYLVTESGLELVRVLEDLDGGRPRVHT